MAATTYAMLGQFAGTSWDNAFPQTPQNGTQDLDLIHIRGVGDQMLAVVNHAGAVSGGSTSALVLASVAVGTLALTSVAVASFAVTSVAVVGGAATYNGTFTGGDANAFVGKSVVVLGFVATAGNNGTFVITGSTATTIVVATTTQANETQAATASVTGVSLVTYNGTITGGGTSAFAGKSVLVAGFTNSANNGTFTIVSSTGALFTTLLTAQVAETHVATAQVAGVSQTTYNGTITGGGSNALAGSTVTVTGFSNSGNNVTTVILSSTGSTIVVLTTTQVNETHVGSAAISLSYTKGGTRIGTFKTFLDNTATIAAIFANAFANPALQDIVQIVSPAGEGVVNYLDYQGVSH